MGDTSWFPTPPRKPPDEPIAAAKLITGGMLAIVAFIAIVLALVNSHSHPHKPSAPAATTTTTQQQGHEATHGENRAAFEACLKSAGIKTGGRSFGTAGSQSKLQAAASLCSSLAGGRGPASGPPITPARGATGGPPAA
jgi:hypothetical protein